MGVFSCRAVIFDLDGVLADSSHAVDGAWTAWAKQHGIDPEVAIRNGHGRTTIEAIAVTAPHLHARRALAQMEALEESFVSTVVPIAGAPEFVVRTEELRIPWAVATSCSHRIALPRLKRARILAPPVLVTAGDVANGKPDPEPYLRAAAALGIAPRDTIVFEDAPAGILSAKRAGAQVICIGAERLPLADAGARDFLDVEIEREGKSARIVIGQCK